MQTSSFALKGIFISILVFLLAGYDTTHGHIITQYINSWVLQFIYVSPEAPEKWTHLYYESLLGITALGSDIILLIMLITIFSDLLYRKQTVAIVYSFVAVVAIFGITEICKQVIDSPRPLFPLEHDSFPSGHTVRASIWCGILLLLNQLKIMNISFCWRVLLWLTPLLVAYTRLGLGRHWLSDVVASLALSSGVFLLVWYVAQRHPFNQYNIRI